MLICFFLNRSSFSETERNSQYGTCKNCDFFVVEQKWRMVLFKRAFEREKSKCETIFALRAKFFDHS